MSFRTEMRRRFLDEGVGRAFRHRDFVIYASTGFAANCGVWLQRVGVQWLAWELTFSYGWIGAISFVGSIGVFLGTPIFGTMIDRGDRLKLMRIAQILMTCLSTTLGILTLTGVMNIWLVVAAMTVHGFCDAFWAPARLAMAPSLVPRKDLSAAIGLGATMFNLAQILGPTAAGLIIAAFADARTGIGVLFLITTCGHLIYLAALYNITLSYEEKLPHAATGFFTDFKEGLVYIFHKPGLTLYMGLMLTTTLVMRPFREMLAGFADGVFAQGPQGLAVLTSAVGAGALIGALVVANIGKVKGLTRMVLGIFAAGIVVQFVFVLAPTFHIAVAAIAVLGATVAIGGIGSQVLVQSSIDASMRGRVVSLWSVIMRAAPPVGAWLIGAVAEFSSLEWAFAGATTLYLISFLIMAPRFRQLAINMEKPPEDDRPA